VVIGAAQAAHVAPARAVPQLEQKRPVAAAPQDGQGAEAGAGEVTPQDNKADSPTARELSSSQAVGLSV
jgi:hypothetical protein